MSCLSDHHKVLSNGVGKCSVPMWCCGYPDGFCDADAYGEQTKEYLDSFKYRAYPYNVAPYASGLACPKHGGPILTSKN